MKADADGYIRMKAGKAGVKAGANECNRL